MELSFSVPPEEYKIYLEAAAKQLSEDKAIDGFRAGKAHYDLIKSRFGEIKIIEAALPKIIKHFYFETLSALGLQAIGEPSVSVTKIAAGDDLEYKLTVALVPGAKLCDWEKIHIPKKEIKIAEPRINAALQDLRKMQTREVRVQRPATKEDKIVVDMDMLRGGVPIDGGTVKKHSIYLGEAYYIPGFTERVLGISANETRNFNLEFPKTHYQKNIAGQLIDFRVRALDVYELLLPELNDAFAATLGQKTITDLRILLEKNLLAEAELKESQRQEIEALEKIIECSRFEDIPEILINEESQRMLLELERSVTEQGLEFQQYLEQIKKSPADLRLDFAAQAIKRVKSALVIRAIAKEKNIAVSDAETLEETTKLMNMYKDDAEAQKQIQNEEYADNIGAYLKNRKTVELIKKMMIR